MKNLTVWLRWGSMCGLPSLPTSGTRTPLQRLHVPKASGRRTKSKALNSRATRSPVHQTLPRGKISRLFLERRRIHKVPDLTHTGGNILNLYQVGGRTKQISDKPFLFLEQSAYKDEAEGKGAPTHPFGPNTAAPWEALRILSRI